MKPAIKTKFGLIREDSTGGFRGYVNFGKNYFSKNEVDILMDYIDKGYSVVENQYTLQGGRTTLYVYKYKDEHGEVFEDERPHIEHPTMLMITKLEKCT